MVISLGGSLIFHNEVNYDLLKKLKTLIKKYSRKYNFVIVSGGGKPAREYMKPLEKENLSTKEVCLTGIRITRLNARFLHKFFNKSPSSKIPKSLKEVKNTLKKNKIVFCGALRYKEDNTSDGTAANIARYLNADFINLTNVKGLYDKDPRKNKNAKFISRISFDDFYKMANKLKYKPGQHFVLDQNASKIIRKYKIRTLIMDGSDVKNLENYIKNKKFKGTIING